jgi:parallel beta-helix repeat protein
MTHASSRWRIRTPGRRVIGTAAVCAGVLAAALTPGIASAVPAPSSVVAPAAASSGTASPAADVASFVPRICGRKILRSPYSYHGHAGRYRSGAAGLPTYGKAGTAFPRDTRGVVLPTGNRSYASYQLRPKTVYYLLPGMHVSSFMADRDDAFVGGYFAGRPSVLGGKYSTGWAIDSNSTAGNTPNVTIEYLTVQKFTPDGNAAAINPDSNTGWTIKYNHITHNVPGAGVILGTDNKLRDNCLDLNGQYGFQSENTNSWGQDSLTHGPYDILVEDNEISQNDTCDFSGRQTNSAIGWKRHDPVPPRFRNRYCGQVTPDGDEGGFKLWQTDGVTVKDNYIHDNWGPGIWADTDNANTTITHNTIRHNEGEGVFEEISYNFAITDNYIADNGWIDGLGNPGFPTSAIYVSESGSDTRFGGVPACPEPSCASQASYGSESHISGNTLVNNGGSVFLWQNSNRYCSDGSDGACTLVDGAATGPFSLKACKSSLASAAINTTTYQGEMTGSPSEDWWDGCMWRTENVSITGNTIKFNPALIPHCNKRAWSVCGAGGMFSEYGGPNSLPEWVVPTELTFFQSDVWSGNTYIGPSTFYAWNQGNGDNPVSWADWTGAVAGGDKCGSSAERQSGYCTGPFGQDQGSTYQRRAS